MKIVCHRGQPYEYTDQDTGTRLFSVSQVRRKMWDGFSRVPADVLEAARIRGKILHARFAQALFAQAGIKPYPAVIPQYVGYCVSMDDWISKVKPQPVKVEQSSMCLRLEIAGTPDALLEIGRDMVLMDLKTGEETPTDSVQLDAYSRMDGYTEAKRKFDLYLCKMGGPAREVERFRNPDDQAAFQNAIAILKAEANIARWRAGK